MYQDVAITLKSALPNEVQVLTSEGRACTIGDAGQLVIHYAKDPTDLIAVYAAGEWRSIFPMGVV